MRVLAHVHTYNAADFIERAVDALHRQTRRPDAIIIVDNASTDGTVDRVFASDVTVIRNPANLGVSGAVRTGFAYGLEHAFDWIWILDFDSVPAPDALERMLNRYAGWPRDRQDQTAFLACLHYNAEEGLPRHGGVFSRQFLLPVKPAPDERCYRCDVTIWSGTLFRLTAVREVGLPTLDYFMDWADIAYYYHLMKAGYTGYIHQDAIINHNVGGNSHTSRTSKFKLFKFYEFPPPRCYYTCRNVLYFLLYDSAERRFGLLLAVAVRLLVMTGNFILRPRNHGAHIAACFRGVWHGVTGNIAARY